MTKLLPCRFCGGVPDFQQTEDCGCLHSLSVTNTLVIPFHLDLAKGSPTKKELKSAAEVFWNKRNEFNNPFIEEPELSAGEIRELRERGIIE